MEEKELKETTAVDPQQIIKQHYQTVGRAGGKATVMRHGKEYMRELGRKSGEKRRLNALKRKNEQGT